MSRIENIHTLPEPIVTSPKGAGRIADLGLTEVYARLKNGDFVSYRDGRSRKILIKSVEDYVARKVAEARSSPTGLHPTSPEGI
jgi:hypothetical protein